MSNLRARLVKLESLDRAARAKSGLPLAEQWAEGIFKRYRTLIKRQEELNDDDKAFIARCETTDLERAKDIILRFHELRQGYSRPS